MAEIWKRLKSSFQRPEGIAGWVYFSYRIIEWLVGKLGDIQALQAVQWAEVWNFISSVLQSNWAVILGSVLIAIALFRSPRQSTNANSPARSSNSEAKSDGVRLSLMDFRKKAQRSGWDVSGNTNLEIMDLMDGLRQAAIDGLPLWGRQIRYGDSALDDREPLLPIPVEHWKDFELDIGPIASGRANEKNHTYNPHQAVHGGSAKKGGYSDLYVDSVLASTWLESTALDFKGKRDARENSRHT